MVSEAKIAANRRNARKSCGPRTETGKQAVRFNALKHGLTAEIALLPDEDPELYAVHRRDWFEIYQPRNAVEAARVERNCYLWWQLQRISRAQSAQLCAHAWTAEVEKQANEARETIELGLQLFMPGREARWGEPETIVDDGRKGETRRTRQKRTLHPALIESQLEGLGDGCRWVCGQWNDLAEPLDSGRAWQAIECFKAIRLLGMQPLSALDLPELADFLRPCITLAGTGIELARETWALLAPPAADQGWDHLRELLEPKDRYPTAEVALARLRSIVRQQVERLTEKLQRKEEVEEILATLGPDTQAFDTSPLAEQTRRYERACQRTADQIDRELRNRPGRCVEQLDPAYSEYRRLNPATLETPHIPNFPSEESTESRGEFNATVAKNEANGHERTGSAHLRNEANGHEGAGSAHLRNEANGLLERGESLGRNDGGLGRGAIAAEGEERSCAEPFESLRTGRKATLGHGGDEDSRAPRRNEPTMGEMCESSIDDAIDWGHGSGAIRLDGLPSELSLGASVEPEARAELSPASRGEVIERRQVGSATVTRFSLASSVKGSRAISRRERRARRREMEERSR